MNWPRAVAIMPTKNRPQMAHRAVHLFLEQVYEGDRHLVVFDDGDVQVESCPSCSRRFELVRSEPMNLPKKRNAMMEHVADERAIYFMWDDDDYHGPDRFRRQVPVVMNHQACILKPTLYYNSITHDLRVSRWLSDATVAYRWNFWAARRFDERLDPGSGRMFCERRNVEEIPGAFDYITVVHSGQRHTPPAFGEPDFTEAPVPAAFASDRLRLR